MATTKKYFFGDLEQAIMDVTWRHGQVTVRGALAELKHKPVAYTTVMTVMNRLVQRGCLRRQMGADGAYVYHSTSSREAYHLAAARQRAHELVKHYGDAALVQFLDTLDHIPEKKLAQLKRQMKQR